MVGNAGTKCRDHAPSFFIRSKFGVLVASSDAGENPSNSTTTTVRSLAVAAVTDSASNAAHRNDRIFIRRSTPLLRSVGRRVHSGKRGATLRPVQGRT